MCQILSCAPIACPTSASCKRCGSLASHRCVDVDATRLTLQLDDVEALCLEGNGAFSCIKRLKPGAKADVLGPSTTLPTR